MYIRLTKSNTSKLVKVYLVEGYRDKNGKVKQRKIRCYGNLHELEAEDPSILEKLRADAKKMPRTTTAEITLNLTSSNAEMGVDQNYGYFYLESIYNTLKIKDFFKKYNHGSKHEFDLNEIFELLIYGRILNPSSKKATFEYQSEFFKAFDVTLDSIYESLGKLDEIKEDLQFHLNQCVLESYNRDASIVFYDVTNYYFETEKEDELKKKGVPKDKKKLPLVQMGLMIDNNGLPIAYQLFPGNTHDSTTMIPFIEKMKEKYNLGKVILTADKGLNSGKNLAYLLERDDGYIVSQKVRGASKGFIEMVQSEEGYEYNKSKTFKIKSFLRDRLTKNDAGKAVVLKEKVVSFWSKNYDAREKKKREKLEARIEEYLLSPSKYKASNKYGIKKYLTLQDVDIETGEIKEIQPYLEFDKEKYERDVSLDGYYTLVTSEIDMSDEEIISRYRGLWKIEESFRVIKSDLEGRPVFVRRNDHVQGHFLVCFVALLISRILENKLEGKHSIRKIQNSIKRATCREISSGIYSLNKQDKTFRDIEKSFGVSLDFQNVRIEQIKSYKKAILHNNFNWNQTS